MAGSWNHAVEKPSGKLLVNEEIVEMLENGGDWYEFAEEAYGMVWFLAAMLELHEVGSGTLETQKQFVEEARRQYKDGLALSPGTDGHIEEEEIDDYPGRLSSR